MIVFSAGYSSMVLYPTQFRIDLSQAWYITWHGMGTQIHLTYRSGLVHRMESSHRYISHTDQGWHIAWNRNTDTSRIQTGVGTSHGIVTLIHLTYRLGLAHRMESSHRYISHTSHIQTRVGTSHQEWA